MTLNTSRPADPSRRLGAPSRVSPTVSGATSSAPPTKAYGRPAAATAAPAVASEKARDSRMPRTPRNAATPSATPAGNGQGGPDSTNGTRPKASTTLATARPQWRVAVLLQERPAL